MNDLRLIAKIDFFPESQLSLTVTPTHIHCPLLIQEQRMLLPCRTLHHLCVNDSPERDQLRDFLSPVLPLTELPRLAVPTGVDLFVLGEEESVL